MNIFIYSKDFFVVLNRGQTAPTCSLILVAKILAPLVCTVWHVCFWHGHHWEVGNILMKKRSIGMLCQSDYLANILTKYFFTVYGACSANHFLTNIFTHSKLHQHVGLILINSLANILASFVPVYEFMNTRFYHWFLVRYFSKWLTFELIK